MELDALGLISACSYALDCVEAELVHVTSEHAKRVAYMSVCVAEQMGIQGKELQDLAVCALLHDNALTQYIIDGFEELRDWAAFHHERLDGTGYPFGKKGLESVIHLNLAGKTAADLNTQERMMACVDIYQALTESRPYKQGMSHEKACGILKDMADKGWIDAEIVSQVDSCFRI